MCTQFAEIKLLDVGTKIHPTLSVSQPLSHREERIPPYSFLKPHEKQAQSFVSLPASSQCRKWEKKERACGNGRVVGNPS